MEQASFRLQPNKIYGLIGENGSGKTTLISILAGIQKSQSGDIQHVSEPGLLLQNVGFYQNLSALDNLRLFAYERGVPEAMIGEVLQLTSFSTDFFQKKYKHLSQGYKQRLGIARSFLTHGNLILLDEPFTAVDLPTVRVLKRAIRQYVAQNGKTLLISSHQLKEVSDLLDETLLIRAKKIVAFQHTGTQHANVLYITFETIAQAIEYLQTNTNIRLMRQIDETCEIALEEDYELGQFVSWLRQANVAWTKIDKRAPLEFLFFDA